jgi:hypothetical protein
LVEIQQLQLQIQKFGMEQAWTEVNDLNTARNYLGGAGTANYAALAFGGETTVNVGNTETWNGTSWTEVKRFKYC